MGVRLLSSRDSGEKPNQKVESALVLGIYPFRYLFEREKSWRIKADARRRGSSNFRFTVDLPAPELKPVPLSFFIENDISLTL